MKITENTRISELIKVNPAAIDVIAAINRHFEKLRNPILRRVLAPRVSIADAAKIGGSSVAVFFEKLKEIGFEIDTKTENTKETKPMNKQVPEFMNDIQNLPLTTLDVRKELASGVDPFKTIMSTLQQMPEGNVLLIINTFEPVPLINILQKKGFEYFTEIKPDGLVYTYLKQTSGEKKKEFDTIEKPVHADHFRFEDVVKRYEGKTKEVDVREMEMPLPMVTILQELATLPVGSALFIHHKKVPQLLLPELKERDFNWTINEIAEGDVKLLIFR